MKIRKHSRDQMILEYRPILFLGLFACVSFSTFAWGMLDFENEGLLKIIFGLIFMGVTIVFAEKSELRLSRYNGQAELRKKSVFGSSHMRFDLDEVSHFEMERCKGDDQDTYRIVMVIKGDHAKGRYPLTSGLYSWLDQDILDAVNSWLHSQERRCDPSAF